MFKGKTKRGVEVSQTWGMGEPTKTTWAIVADRTGARIFEQKQGHFVPRADFVCPEGRTRDREVGSDQPGRSFDSRTRGQGDFTGRSPRHALERSISDHDRIALSFASDLARHLEEKLNEQNYGRLYLVAEPRFLGLLRAALSPEVAKRLAGTVAKDCQAVRDLELSQLLPEMLGV